MKLHKVELKEVTLYDDIWNPQSGAFDRAHKGKLLYREVLRQILTGPSLSGSISASDLIQSVEINTKLKMALLSKESYFLLDDEEFAFLNKRISDFPWSAANEAISDFILYIKNIQPQEATVTLAN